MYGPKGVGALYVRRRPRVRVRPLIDGFGQERGMRSGTLPAPLCVGLGAAAAVARQELARDERSVERQFARLRTALAEELPKVHINGAVVGEARFRGNCNASFAGVEGESLLMAIARSTAVSSGSACTSASLEPSYVLRALGVDEGLAHGSLRFGVGRFTSDEDVERVAHALSWFSRVTK